MARGLRLNSWALLSALFALGALCAWPLPREALEWQGSLNWRAFTAAFVHWTPLHLGANLLGCAAVGWFGIAARLPARSTVAWLIAWPLTQCGLLLRPELVSFGGLSGVLHAGVAIAGVELLLQAPRERRIGMAIMAGLAFKIATENPLGPALQQVSGWDMPVVPLAHLSGAVAGLISALAIIAATSGRPSAGP